MTNHQGSQKSSIWFVEGNRCLVHGKGAISQDQTEIKTCHCISTEISTSSYDLNISCHIIYCSKTCCMLCCRGISFSKCMTYRSTLMKHWGMKSSKRRESEIFWKISGTELTNCCLAWLKWIDVFLSLIWLWSTANSLAADNNVDLKTWKAKLYFLVKFHFSNYGLTTIKLWKAVQML